MVLHSLLLLCAALALGSALPVQAADPPPAYTFRSYGPEQGLANQSVTAMAQDKDGFIYAATEDGLFRYDGSHFERFGSEQGLPGQAIAGLYTEPSGRLWVLDAKGALAWAGTRPDPGVAGPILPKRTIASLAATRSGHLIAVTEAGVYEGQAASLALVRGLPRLDGGAAWIAPDGSVTLVASHGVLYRRLGQHGAWSSRALRPGLANELVHTIMLDKAGRIWIRGPRFLLRLASFEGAQLDLSGQLPGTAVLKGQLVRDPQGRIWTPTNGGLVRFDDSAAVTISDQHGLPGQSVTSMLFDREGTLWTSSEGIHRLQGALAWSVQTRRQQLPTDTVWAVTRTGDGVLWAGTNRGLARAGAGGWSVVPGTEARRVYAFAQDRDGMLWVAGNNPKAARNTLLVGTGERFRSIELDLAGPSTVNSIAFGPGDALYMGTQTHGLHRLVRNGDAWRGETVALPGGESKEQINQVLYDARGRLWAAGMGGLALYRDGQWRRFGKADGLLDDHVEALVADAAGNLLVSYWSVHGLTRLTEATQGAFTISQVTTPPELVADNIYSLGYDADGALWLGTGQGVKRLKNGRLQQFGRGEGLPSEDATANAFWADRNGDVWFGMASGLAHYHADAAPPAPSLPSTHVLRVEDGSGATLAPQVPAVEWDNRALTFRFAVLSFRNENRVRPQVRLVGFEDGWRDTKLREARYTGLPPGRYRFEARASLNGRDFGPSSMREVHILAPWWRTWWATGLGILGAVGALLLMLRWRTRYMRRRTVMLEGQVQARTRALELANQALEQANAALKESSMVDPLTGLKNRRFLGLSMADELARVSRQNRGHDPAHAEANGSLLFFMVDLDHFKAVNDTYGHAAGDLVLQHASAALRAACRDADFVVRWGGEEFMIVARNSDRASAPLLAGHLRDAVRKLRIDVGNGVVLHKTCSIGFAAWPVLPSAPDAYAWEDAVAMADQSLYAAKHSGRDAWVGVVLAAGTPDPGPRVTRELGQLVDDGTLPALSSFAPTTALRWQ